MKDEIDAVVCSPVRRTRESAEILAAELGLVVEEEPGFAEMEFGAWDGLSFMEVAEQHKESFDAWLGDLDSAPPGGESFRVVEARVMAGLDRVLEQHAGRTVVVVSHVTPIKTLVANTLKAPLEAVFRMELSPASVTVISFYPDRGAPPVTKIFSRQSTVHARLFLHDTALTLPDRSVGPEPDREIGKGQLEHSPLVE